MKESHRILKNQKTEDIWIISSFGLSILMTTIWRIWNFILDPSHSVLLLYKDKNKLNWVVYALVKQARKRCVNQKTKLCHWTSIYQVIPTSWDGQTVCKSLPACFCYQDKYKDVLLFKETIKSTKLKLLWSSANSSHRTNSVEVNWWCSC